jgi:hypothetical protein
MQVVQEFPKKSTVHKGFTLTKPVKVLETAKFCCDERAFAAAVSWLAEAEEQLDDYNARAEARVKQQNEDAASLAAAKKKKAEAELEAAEDKAKQEARENADDVSSLKEIGRDKQFGKWIVNVKKLLELDEVSVSAGAPYDLNPNNPPDKQTVEVILIVAPTGTGTIKPNTFVVHYHPQAKGATVENPGASPMHVKPHKGNSLTSRTDLGNTHWLIAQAYVPTFGNIKRQFGRKE